MIDYSMEWIKKAEKELLNRKIVAIRYMTSEEMETLGWYSKAIVLQLDNGHLIFPSQDDEGNDAGALFTTSDETPVIPVMR